MEIACLLQIINENHHSADHRTSFLLFFSCLSLSLTYFVYEKQPFGKESCPHFNQVDPKIC